MRRKIAGTVGVTGFMIVVGSAGALELGGSLIAYIGQSVAGMAMMAGSVLWYKNLEHRRVRHHENGIERRPDTY